MIGFAEFDQARTFLNQAYSVEVNNPEELRKSAKESLRRFLDYLFNSDEVEEVSYIKPAHYCVFYLKNDNGCHDKYQFIISNTCHFASMIIKNDSYAIQLHSDIKNRHAVGVFIISKVMSRNRLEWVFNTQIEGCKPDRFWDCWEDHDRAAMERYDQYIHPSICEAVSQIIDDWKGDELFTILDIGGGKGKLAERIVGLMPFYSNYLLLEKNEVSIEQAKKVLWHRATVVCTDIVEENQFFQDEAKKCALKANSVSIAIACGVLASGVLNCQIDALHVLQKIYTSLRPGGYLIVSGYTASFIEAKELQECGFETITMSLPGCIGIQFYVARKRTTLKLVLG